MWKSDKFSKFLILSLSLVILSGFMLLPSATPTTNGAHTNNYLYSFFVSTVQAQESQDVDNVVVEDPNLYYSIYLDEPTIAKGYTVTGFNDALKLSLVPGILSEDTRVDIVQLHEPMETPWQLDKISQIYQFEFRNKAAYDDHKPFYIQFSYDTETNDYKQVYFYDKNFNAWRPLPTRDFPEDKFVRSLIHLPYARIAVFSNPEVPVVGRASWYAYKGGHFTASPDFPKGSELRVYNTENGKYVDVTVNDWGPDRGVHPDRVVDLDKVAFSALAPTWQGTIDVRVELLYIEPNQGRVLGIADGGATSEPVITARAAMVQNEQTGEIYFTKNASSSLPIASLTKLVAIKTFLDTKPTLNQVVNYNLADEEYNYQYCDKWESARLKVEDGDSMTIEDLLYASLVGSANNTVETLVRVSGMTRDQFISKMNETALAWGAVATKFTDPTGLDPNNISSAADYAIITREVLKHPIIQKSSTMDRYEFDLKNRDKHFLVINTNKIIARNKYNITGSKTGYLDESLYCLMTRAKAGNGEQIIVVILGVETRERSFLEVEDLLRYAMRQAF